MGSEGTATSEREFWFDEATDRAMEAEHRFVWETMVDRADVDLQGARVLDVGCSTGGFLRMLVDEAGIGEGFGYDPAPGAIRIAEDMRGKRPLAYSVGGSRPEGWDGFDAAFSHEVLFLVHDLEAHARDVLQGLRAGGVYYAVMGTHDRNPALASWHASVAEQLGLPPIYSLEDVLGAFTAAGFEPHLGRLRVPFVPGWALAGKDLDQTLDYYDRHKMMFKFVRP
jgi:SAM-dependent methyltransferase